jgi:hypothetical protein
VTVKEASDTKYLTGTSSASASAVAAGDSVLVLGVTDSTAITATEVILQPVSAGRERPHPAAGRGGRRTGRQ